MLVEYLLRFQRYLSMHSLIICQVIGCSYFLLYKHCHGVDDEGILKNFSCLGTILHDRDNITRVVHGAPVCVQLCVSLTGAAIS